MQSLALESHGGLKHVELLWQNAITLGTNGNNTLRKKT